jgi:two-component system, OmpR family, sensor histidine kinase CiaH
VSGDRADAGGHVRATLEPPPRDVFARAGRRLGELFLVIVVVLVVASSLVIYLSFRNDLQQLAARGAGGGDATQNETEAEFVNRSLVSFRWRLLALDGVIILAVGVGGLLYARSTLRPIRDNVAAQKRFIADASHELRTPLAVMKTEFEVALRDPALPGDVRPLLTDGLEEVDRMSDMVDDLLTLSRIDAHQEVVSREPVDLGEIAADTAERLRPLAETAGVSLVVDGPGAAPAVGDGRHLRRAVANLVRNAVEHSPRGGRVTVTAVAGSGRALVVVADEGSGIPQDELSHVFDRFYSADPAHSRERGGSGLGLAIARWAVREMGGDLSADSAVGHGTRMTVSLPTPRA